MHGAAPTPRAATRGTRVGTRLDSATAQCEPTASVSTTAPELPGALHPEVEHTTEGRGRLGVQVTGSSEVMPWISGHNCPACPTMSPWRPALGIFQARMQLFKEDLNGHSPPDCCLPLGLQHLSESQALCCSSHVVRPEGAESGTPHSFCSTGQSSVPRILACHASPGFIMETEGLGQPSQALGWQRAQGLG